ncbi:AraC family transcriptional regulator [Nonomuraea aridisoli]|uniref:AraC family transcriptional regulator n=1 Tax=Nonomuraea aridisoli TaxID=2070368 RepID=A0A2W2DA25_9ACTN|nr:AraC family transcriptional regulator [Nonomuraea aridisoli]PZG07151.1 AraC family transcriptional regulator [Nonomuraea aridisoli]
MEHLRAVPGHRLRFGRGAQGIERLEAALVGEAFSPHRHDTYAIGMTLTGVQTFRYRGELRRCLPGEWHVLHPDEEHDGAAGTDEGFGYRILYVDPYLVQEALGGRPLPFVADPVVGPEAMDPALAACLRHLDEPLEELAWVEVVTLVAAALERLADAPARTRSGAAAGPPPVAALARVRELIAADPAVRRTAAELEQVSGLDRWTIARQFRAVFGTSPTRFRTMRRLDLTRRALLSGLPLGEAALAAGFADQSHMTRMFRRAYGLTPGQWLAAQTGSPAVTDRPRRSARLP